MDGTSKIRGFLQGLPTAIQLHILSLVPPNDRTLNVRFVSRDARDLLTEPQDCTASLSQTLPPHAAPWAMAAGQQHVRQLPFMHKPQLLCTAAASGSEVNLEVALALLQPSVFPELLQTYQCDWCEALELCDPGVAAVTAGHPQLLGWLLRQCPGLLRPANVLAAAAKHCTLAGLQATWEALQKGMPGLSSNEDTGSGGGGRLTSAMRQWVLDSAASSATPDYEANVMWVLSVFPECRLGESTLLAVARTGDLGRMQWLQERGCHRLCACSSLDTALRRCSALEDVLQHCDVAVAQWLVDEAGCALPTEQEEHVRGLGWDDLLWAAARSADGVVKLKFLRDRGGPPLAADRARDLAVTAALAGRAEVVRYLVSLYRPDAVLQGATGSAADGLAGSDGRIIAAYLRQGGIVLTRTQYRAPLRHGDLAAVRWLAGEMGVSAAGLYIVDMLRAWPKETAAHSRDLREALQLLVGAGCDWHSYLHCYAAAQGDLALAQYLQQQCPDWRPDGNVVAPAAQGGCEALLEWLVEQPGCRTGTAVHASPYIMAAKHGDRGTLAALRRLGVPWERDDLVLGALWTGCPLPAARWLSEQGAPVGSMFYLEHVVKCRLRKASDADTAAWLHGLLAAADDDAVVMMSSHDES